METYHRKVRSKNDGTISNEMVHLKTQETTDVVDDAGAQTPHIARHDELPPPDNCTSGRNTTDEASNQSIEVGSVYEIDHYHLPPRSPAQLQFIRVVMVSEMTAMNVSVRFPSLKSVQSYLQNTAKEMYPQLDDKFVMGTELAHKVLMRQIPSPEFSRRKHLEGFWSASSTPEVNQLGDLVSNKGICLSEIKNNGMVQWGVRRQVKFLGKHKEKEKENSNPQSSSSIVKGEEQSKCKVEEEEEEEEPEENGDHEQVEEDITEEAKEIEKSPKKRKQYDFRNARKPKKARIEKKNKNKCKQIVLKNPINRWSQERYKLAEKNLLEVMKAKEATFNNPILRPELRAEARKRIGDTGLLDHLLKHMAGKIAPGGKDRFRRRYNSEGAMEYWLESADLVNIRKLAEVEDPYWTPPPGWKPGDCPTQDPICAKELKMLKEEILNMKRNLEEMVTQKQLEKEIAKLRRQIEELISKEKQEKSQALVVSSPVSDINPKLDPSILSSESDPDHPTLPLDKHREELVGISGFLEGIEKKMEKLTSKRVEEKRRGTDSESDWALMAWTDTEKEENKGKAVAEEKAAAAEEKAAKIQRLKSGFRICKPHGTFLWPNMNRTALPPPPPPPPPPQVEDIFMLPTPPSVSSSSSSSALTHHHHPNPTSPVKPLAERRAVKVTVSTVSTAATHEGGGGGKSYSTTTTTAAPSPGSISNTAATHINLNDNPFNLGDGFCGTPSSREAITDNTTTVMPRLLMPSATANREKSPWETVGSSAEHEKVCSSSSSYKGVGKWLALAYFNPTSDNSNPGLSEFH